MRVNVPVYFRLHFLLVLIRNVFVCLFLFNLVATHSPGHGVGAAPGRSVAAGKENIALERE